MGNSSYIVIENLSIMYPVQRCVEILKHETKQNSCVASRRCIVKVFYSINDIVIATN